MHPLHRSSVFGCGGGAGGEKGKNKAARRRVGSSPRAPLMSKSESIRKRSSGVKQGGSKRARLRAGLAAALHELRLAGHRKRGAITTRPGAQARAPPCCADAAATPAAASPEEPATSSRGSVTSGTLPPFLMLVLALACVVALGRAPAVLCCCSCAAWWCRAASADEQRRGGVLCSEDAVRLRPQPDAASISSGAASAQRC